jgi:3-phenylpropionate/trans-cinnamate dioxygenase ferredoxin component
MSTVIEVCPADDLPPGEVAVAEDTPDGRVAVFNVDGELYGLEDRCSHQQAWLSDGYVEDCAVECPLHASMFDLRTGQPSGLPANRPVRTYRAFLEDGTVKVEVP